MGNIAPADLQTVCIVPSHPKKPRLAATTPRPALLPVHIRPQYFRSPPPITARCHTPPCAGRCLARPLLTLAPARLSPSRCMCACDLTSSGPRLAEIPLFLRLPALALQVICQLTASSKS